MTDDFGSDFIILTDDDGEEFELEHLDTLEHNGKTYMAFIPAEQVEAEEIELVILRVEKEDEEEILISVDDEAELEEVYQLFMAALEADEDEESSEVEE